MTAPPSITDITSSRAALDASVPPEFIDVNGHVNVQHYLHLGTLGVGTLLDLVGLDEAYRRDRGFSVFTRKHHVEYLHELLLGDRVSIHAFAVDRSRAAVHAVSYIVDARRQRLAATVETMLVHIDLVARRPVPIPGDLAARIDAEVTGPGHARFEHSLSGALALRH